MSAVWQPCRMGWHELLAHGVTHGGVVGRRCCPRAADVAPTTFDARAARERWTCLAPGVYLLPGYPLNNVRRTVGTALAVGPHAAVTGLSALGLHGLLRSPPTAVELLVPSGHQRSTLPRVRTHWSQSEFLGSTTSISGIAVADVARSLADRAATAELSHLRAIAFDAVSHDLLRPDQLHRELEDRQRFPGRSRYRQLLDDLRGDGSQSGFEFDTRDQLIVAGLPPDPDQAEVATRTATRRIDIPYRRWGVGIECLGYAYHGSAAALQRDASRANAIAALDEWLILRLTWRMLHEQWEPFLRDLRDSLRRRGARI